tara:strand:+ start:2090 stop:3007 length:918 start_codon:yes stop_codon:yes gene_type:complete
MNPFDQTNLFGLKKYFDNFRFLYDDKKLPNKILLSGSKGLGKCSLALHLINYVLSKDEAHAYDYENLIIDENNRSFKLIKNKSSPNFYLIDIQKDKKNIDIKQIREMINFCNKSSLNNKPRFILIDNIELMNLSSNNALLKTLEEPNENIYYILINNSSKILPTVKSRCLEFKITLSHNQCIDIFNKITKKNIYNLISKNLISHYLTTGDLITLYNFADENDINLLDLTLNEFLLKVIDGKYYKKEILKLNFIFIFVQMYLLKNYKTTKDYYLYSKFIELIQNTKRFNLDTESLFIQFKHQLEND